MWYSHGTMDNEKKDALDELEAVALAIRALRTRYAEGLASPGLRLTQERLAEEVGIDPCLVGRLLNGTRAWADPPQRNALLAWHERRLRCLKRA